MSECPKCDAWNFSDKCTCKEVAYSTEYDDPADEKEKLHIKYYDHEDAAQSICNRYHTDWEWYNAETREIEVQFLDEPEQPTKKFEVELEYRASFIAREIEEEKE